MADNADLQYIAAIDTSEYDAALDRMVASADSASSEIASTSERMNALLSNIPQVDISWLTEATPTLNGIGEAYAEIARVVRLNTEAIGELEVEYQRVSEEANKFANVPSMHEHYKELLVQKDVLKQNIAVRQEVIAAAKREEAELQRNEKQLVAEARAAERSAQAEQKHAQSATTLRQRIKELTAEAAALREAAQAEGREIDKNTGRYAELIQEIGRLKDIQGDIQAAGSVFANDENQIAGVIQGVTGLTGAFQVAQGAVGLFGAENEKLNEIMMRVQSLMSITMGLQQIQQVLNKDSTFMLVTMNSLKSAWNKITGQSATVQVAETNATRANTSAANVNNAAKEENVAVTEAHTTAEVLDTEAQTANASASKAGATAKGLDAAATKAATAETNAHTTATVAQTTAVSLGTKALRLFKIALISTGIGALIVAVGELISWITDLITAEDEAIQKTKDVQKINEEAAKTYIQEKVALEDNIKMCQTFKGTKEQERKKVDELNSKYGEALGYYDSLEQWERVLQERGPAYCEMLRMKAVQQGLLNKYVEEYVHALEIAHKAENGEFDRGWYNPARWFGESNDDRRERIKQEAQKDVQYWEQQMKQQKSELEKFQRNNHFDVVHIDPKAKNVSGGGKGSGASGATFDSEAAARAQMKAIDDYQKKVSEYIKQSNTQLSQDMIASLKDGLGKEITQIRYNGHQRTQAWKESILQLAEAHKQSLHDIFMAQNGATENDWFRSAAGKKSVEDYVSDILGVSMNDLANATEDQLTEVGKTAQSVLASINEGINRQINDAQQKHLDQFIDTYGTIEQKEFVLWRKYTDALNSIPESIQGDERERMTANIHKAFEAAFAQLELDDLKEDINWEDVFGNLDKVSTDALKKLRTKLQAVLKQTKDPKAAKELVEAIDNINAKLTERNPFSELGTAIDDLRKKNKDLKAAQEEYNRVLKEGTDAEKAQAKATLDAAKAAKQKALATATEALQSACNQIKGYIEIANTLQDALSSFGVELPEELTGFIGGIGQAVDSLSEIDLTKPMSIVKGAIGAIGGIGKAIGSLFNHDARKEKRIQKLQTQIDDLDRAIANVDKQIDGLFSTDQSKMLDQENAMLQRQKKLIQEQIEQEKSKKDTDNNRIRDWENQLKDIDEQIAENKKAALDAIFGSDLKSAIENFADAYADAWASGEDRAKSAKDTVRNMMKQMVRESIKAAIQASGQMEAIRQKLADFFRDGVLSDWEQKYIENMAESLQAELDAKFGWADKLLGEDAEREGASRGIATASQDSVDENNARLTVIQSHTYTLVQSVAELNTTGNAILEHVVGIESNTKETSDRLENLTEETRRVRNAVEDITTRGINLKS